MTRQECGESLRALIDARDEALLAAGVEQRIVARLSKLEATFLGATVGRCRPDYLRGEAIRWRSKHAREALRPGPLPRAGRLVAARFALALADIFDLAAETEPSTC